MKMVHSSDTPNTTSAFCVAAAPSRNETMSDCIRAMTTVCTMSSSHMSRMERAMTSVFLKKANRMATLKLTKVRPWAMVSSRKMSCSTTPKMTSGQAEKMRNCAAPALSIDALRSSSPSGSPKNCELASE